MRDGSGNPLWNEVEQRLQRTARPEVFTKGHAQIKKTFINVLQRYINMDI